MEVVVILLAVGMAAIITVFLVYFWCCDLDKRGPGTQSLSKVETLRFLWRLTFNLWLFLAFNIFSSYFVKIVNCSLVPGTYRDTPGSYRLRHSTMLESRQETAVSFNPTGDDNGGTEAGARIIPATPFNPEGWRDELQGGTRDWDCDKFYLERRALKWAFLYKYSFLLNYLDICFSIRQMRNPE